MSRKAYRATRVNDVNWEQIARGKEGLGVTVGIDVGKFDLWVVCRWADGRFERPWRVKNPWEIPTLVGVLKQVKADRKLVVALEPSGTYGEALRQALGDNGIDVQRVGTKASHDVGQAPSSGEAIQSPTRPRGPRSAEQRSEVMRRRARCV